MVQCFFFFSSTKSGTNIFSADLMSMYQESFVSRLMTLVSGSTGGFAAYVVRALPYQDQQLSLPGGMMHSGINDQRGEDCGSFTLIRGKERGRTHSEAMLSSLVHAFRQSSVKTLKRTPVCGSQRPNTTHPWSLRPARFISASSFSVYFLFIIAHPAYAVFSGPLPLSFFPLSRLL